MLMLVWCLRLSNDWSVFGTLNYPLKEDLWLPLRSLRKLLCAKIDIITAGAWCALVSFQLDHILILGVCSWRICKMNELETQLAVPSVSVHLYDPSMQKHRDSQMAQMFVWFTNITCQMEIWGSKLGIERLCQNFPWWNSLEKKTLFQYSWDRLLLP